MIKDLTGKIVNIEGTEAVCILQTPTKRIYAAVGESKKPMTWYEAQEWCKKQFNGKGHCPDRAESIWLYCYHWDKVKHDGSWWWTSEKYASTSSWFMFSDGYMGNDYRGNYNYVRAFYTEELTEE